MTGPAELLAIGAAAARIGVAASTLRTWERRYGLAPTGRSAGGHRRYTGDDLALLERMHALTLAGRTPARAALEALRGADADDGPGAGGPVGD
ncbi:MerR family transcriptional regulator, partial [Kineosporia sp. A_224]|uniref:MerR family transcriptional regulator n=1 Tax=Kineosporia sp. A_224 TaxID=1962180 RepID=UPI0018EA02BE